MKDLSRFANSNIDFVFTDIDDTLTDDGKLPPISYEALWKLHNKGIHVVPITGRPAGWVEMIARFWPVSGVIGENGGLYFRYENRTMKRYFVQDEKTRDKNRTKLDKLAGKILKEVPGTAISSDQFCRLLDLAIDYCEDVDPLDKASVGKIVDIFEESGATAKVSSIHVNGWFGAFDKLTMCKEFLEKEFQLDFSDCQERLAFVGDSPNDAPMFAAFSNSFGVANVRDFLEDLESEPEYVAPSSGGSGFAEIAERILQLKA